jgi:hypothetical protein
VAPEFSSGASAATNGSAAQAALADLSERSGEICRR